jgi:hypothetical protein
MKICFSGLISLTVFAAHERREKGEGRREKREGRREKGEGRRGMN